MRIGYIRVSTSEQRTERQLDTAAGESKTELAHEYGASRPTLYGYLDNVV